MYLVDLAGTERLAKSGAQGMRLAEAKKISLSLFTLRLVLSALAFNKSHIPFRDSKLTRVLQESLGGNSHTTLIINCSIKLINYLYFNYQLVTQIDQLSVIISIFGPIDVGRNRFKLV